ncbi:MAG: hypothetical protein I3273_05495 [Candidatus Moeniiplasma glomeromycotorum]|nr:hypothetical protein [Candidatus Moeniiplasma glomeromycotorum]MCE8169544.1 hypothetical protein [Candidatus Moeniiplasma glomeromycotorum]
MTNNWKDIHEGFYNLIKVHRRSKPIILKEKWKSNGFNYHKTRDWINIGLDPHDYNFAWWLEAKKNRTPENGLNCDDIGELKKEYYNLLKHLEQEWKEFVNLDSSSSSGIIMEWMKKDFDYQKSKQWISNGLKPEEYEFAFYLQEKGHDLLKEDLKKLRKEFYEAQNWLNWNYPKSRREKVKSLDISKENLEGSLKLENFTNLEKLDCSGNKLNDLDLNNCLNLKIINCNENDLTSLVLTKLIKLEEISCVSNQLTKLNLNDSIKPKKFQFWDNYLIEKEFYTSPNLIVWDIERLVTSENNFCYYLIVNNNNSDEAFFCFSGAVKNGWEELVSNWESLREVEVEFEEKQSFVGDQKENGFKTYRKVISLAVPTGDIIV